MFVSTKYKSYYNQGYFKVNIFIISQILVQVTKQNLCQYTNLLN